MNHPDTSVPRTAIYREPTPEEAELAQRRDELNVKRRMLAQRELALSERRGQLFSFEGRYIRQVGVLYKQLDEWEERIAELHVRMHPAELDDDILREEVVPSAEQASETQSPDLRAMFRELAKRIHPDFASDSQDEHRRTRLMAQANDALRRKDLQALQRMLNGFEGFATGTSKEDVAAALADVLAQTRQIEMDIASAEADFRTLDSSEMAKLQQQTIQAALDGRDLLAEMAARVKGRIGMAMRQYELDMDRMKRPAKGLKVEDLVTAETTREPPRSLRYDAARRTWVR